MGLQKYRTLVLVVALVLALFVASPAIEQMVIFPQTDSLTELSILGPYHNATYPYNIVSNQKTSLYIDVTNHMGSTALYLIDVKFRDQTQSAPDSFNHTSSDQPALGQITFCVANNGTIELPVDVSFQYITDGNNETLTMQNIVVNGAALSTDTTIAWNPDKQGFMGNLFFELWMFNDTSGSYQYNDRFVSLWLKMNA